MVNRDVGIAELDKDNKFTAVNNGPDPDAFQPHFENATAHSHMHTHTPFDTRSTDVWFVQVMRETAERLVHSPGSDSMRRR